MYQEGLRMNPSNEQKSVYVMPIIGKAPHLRFVWTEQPTLDDIENAFAYIDQVLDRADTSVHIIVDVRSQPKLPLGKTMTNAIKAQRTDTMGMWLVIGADWRAEFIGKTISSVGKNNIEWFDSEEEAIQRLDELMQT